MPVPRRRPTVKDVAAEAGVAVMTVSYTFNRPARVAEATRQRVLAAAERLGYRRPDSTARALRSGRTGQVGVVVGEHLAYAFDDPQASQFLAGVADVCVHADMGMVLIPTHGHPSGTEQTSFKDDTDSAVTSAAAVVSDVDRVLSAAVDAYVLWTTTINDPVLEAVATSGRPVAIQGGPALPGIVCIAPDDRAAATAVAAAVLTSVAPDEPTPVPVVLSFPLDHDRIPALLRGRDLPPDLIEGIGFPVTAHRLAGYRDALVGHGHDWDEVVIAVVERNHRRDGQAAATDLLEHLESQAPLLVLAMSDELALGTLDALTPAGRSAYVSGWDASPAGRKAGITSVTNALREQGRQCAQAVLGLTPESTDVPWEITSVDEMFSPVTIGRRILLR